ncbi:MAG: polysaccharide pyruvyl transferase family protein, partial [Lutibacter sp.]
AEMVITSSFHGTALSILMEKEFYSAILPTRGSRITNILNKAGLEDRIIIDDNLNLNKTINYDVVNSKVDKIRTNSINYLEDVFKLLNKNSK